MQPPAGLSMEPPAVVNFRRLLFPSCFHIARYIRPAPSIKRATTNTRMHAPARGGNSEIQQNKLLEQGHGNRLEFGTAAQAVGSDPAMATVGKLDRAANG